MIRRAHTFQKEIIMSVTRFYSGKEKRAGRKLLAKLLPRITKIPRDLEKLTSFLGKHPQLRITNVDSVVLYEADGGWQADLVLFDGHGGPDVMGTETAHPKPNRQAAEDAATRMLAGLLSLEVCPSGTMIH
jgi:hypothetical protein